MWWCTLVIPATHDTEIRKFLVQRQSRQKVNESQVLVAHTYNPNYSGGRDQENRGLKAAWAK
jgi:hypothetical protein